MLPIVVTRTVTYSNTTPTAIISVMSGTKEIIVRFRMYGSTPQAIIRTPADALAMADRFDAWAAEVRSIMVELHAHLEQEQTLEALAKEANAKHDDIPF